MSFYPQPIDDRFNEPRCAGEIDKVDAEGIAASFVCGSHVAIAMRIEPETTLIEACRFRSNGCGYMVATADLVCESFSGKSLSDLHGLPESELLNLIDAGLGKFPAERSQCAAVVFESLRKTLAGYRAARVDEFRGEQALICTCFGVTEDTLVDAIKSEKLTDVDEVGVRYRAGTGCGSCRMLIEELIEAQARRR